MAKSECVITIKPVFDTEALEILRVMHLKCAAEIAETIERLAQCGVSEDEDGEHDDDD